jgi:hypothetical protein
MDALHLFLVGHAGLRFRLDRLSDLSDAQWRLRPHGLNSAAWLVWHMARTEDVAVNRLVADRRQVGDEQEWLARLGIGRRDIGTGMTTEEVADLGARVDVAVLRGYAASVLERTEAVARELRPADLDEVVDAPHPAVRSIQGWLGDARLEVRYPGIWVRDDVYATHGHYLDSHVTMPTIERLTVATIDRLGGRPTGRRSTPHDYEQVHAPIYDLIFNLAQGGRSLNGRARDGKPPAMRIWELMGGASGRARTLQGRLLGSAVIPAALRGMERAGFGSFTRDFSSGEIGRAGVDAMHAVVSNLGIDADYVVFGHIHRRGPLLTDDGRSASDPAWARAGTTLFNTGNWQYVEGLMGRAEPGSPFWPGSMVVVEDEGAPELVEILDAVSRDVLSGRRP